MTHITKTAAPTFILHGTKDKTVPISQSERLYVALKKADAIVKIKTIENAGHEGQEFRTPETLAEVDAFLREQLKIPANANL